MKRVGRREGGKEEAEVTEEGWRDYVFLFKKFEKNLKKRFLYLLFDISQVEQNGRK